MDLGHAPPHTLSAPRAFGAPHSVQWTEMENVEEIKAHKSLDLRIRLEAPAQGTEFGSTAPV